NLTISVVREFANWSLGFNGISQTSWSKIDILGEMLDASDFQDGRGNAVTSPGFDVPPSSSPDGVPNRLLDIHIADGMDSVFTNELQTEVPISTSTSGSGVVSCDLTPLLDESGGDFFALLLKVT